MDTATAVRVFLRQANREQDPPFRPRGRCPNTITRAALDKADAIAEGRHRAPSHTSREEFKTSPPDR
ncbi:MAG: hypothetical protein LBU05_07710 [Bifidobacteriaceae bacterium]|jgi:antitoxin component of RelBE/YafQ-DinJ toxin-antitoxin module|nr:hypothetical protein [Bifidobacteriaceae bacterium]